MSEQTHRWPKKITVDKRIVRILSGSTYANFPSAIRELITNSYDADAETVNITIDLDNEIITVSDTGKGMSEEDFAFYLRIAGKSRKKDDTQTKSNRKIVGQFGVGFLSILPFCERYSIETKKRNTDEIVQATILSTTYFNEEFSTIDVDEIPIQGGIKRDANLYYEQYTTIRLVGFSKLTRSFFDGQYKIQGRKSTKINFSPIELFKWELSEYLPLEYEETNETAKELNKLIANPSSLPFNVYLNQKKLYRNLHAKTILEKSEHEISIGEIKFKYALLSSFEPIDPIEARYLMLRNLNVGVGERTTFNLGLDGKVYGKLAHITGEVFITEGLNDLISVSRDKFNFSPDYEALKDFLRDKLARWANDFDAIRQSERKIVEHQNVYRVSDIVSLKKENFEKEISKLENRGFSVERRPVTTTTTTLPVQVDQENKKVIIPLPATLEYDKLIKFRNNDYKLQVKNWPLSSSLPVIRKNDDIFEINEAYPLFKDKNFDAFLKMHLILFEYLNNNQINHQTYLTLVEDLSTITI